MPECSFFSVSQNNSTLKCLKLFFIFLQVENHKKQFYTCHIGFQVIGKMSAPAGGDEADLAAKPGLVLPDAAPPSFPGIPPTTHPALHELKQPPAQPQGTGRKTVSVQHTHC